jgi:hypothetical protein
MTVRLPKVSGLPEFLDALMRPETMPSLSVRQWNSVLRFGRQTALSARLAYLARSSGVWDRIPEKARQHFESAEAISRDNRRMIRYDVSRIAAALDHAKLPFALLKGAAYVWSDLDMAEGRLSSDVDILVARHDLEAAEEAVKAGGWVPLEHDEYDDYYYRTWMHELPPLRHHDSNTIIDIHHTILPVTSRLHPDPALLVGDMVPVGQGRMHVLAPKDMVLHAAAHLFYDGDFDRRLRDLYDLDRMLVHFGSDPGFWKTLVRRAEVLNLTIPLFYTLRYCSALLGTPVPAEAIASSKHGAPSYLSVRLMDSLLPRAIMPRNADHPSRVTSLAAFLLYLRSHWLRMPPLLLLRHLLRKAFKRFSAENSAPAETQSAIKLSNH